MTDYTELVKALRDIEKAMFALGTSPINMDNVSIRLAYDKKWGRTANDAADAIEALQAQLPKRGEIVRCGECVNWERDWEPTKRGNDGMEWHYCPMIDSSSCSDWFCADGEREVRE